MTKCQELYERCCTICLEPLEDPEDHICADCGKPICDECHEVYDVCPDCEEPDAA